uniref:Capsid protein VP1 n=10 Tax=Protoparvovirus TaxID=1506574 RepID=A0A7M1QIV7_9VIRU|nr:VP1 [Canine bufavirus]QTD19008.1 VP1 [Bufavirus Henan38]
MPPTNRPRKGWVPPGYNYLGPGNTDFSIEETNQSDKAAKAHDLEYNKLLQKGQNPYIYFNHADEDFIQATNQASDWGGKFGNFIFKAKKAIAPELGPPKKKSKEEPGPSYSWRNIKPGTKRGKPFHIFVNRARAAKKQRLEQMSDQAAEDGQQQPAVGAAGGHASGGGGGGGSGVGHSTGAFNNRTEFHYHNGEVTIVCHATRQVHLNMPGSEEYLLYQTDHGPRFPKPGDQQLQGRDTINDSYHAKVETPWSLLHANCWGVWFNPADFQHMTAICNELEIIGFEQEIDNIVIKTVTKQGTGQEETTQYNNDLTALLEIAEDKSNLLPWASDNMYIDSLGYVPWRPSKLPRYCYHVNFWNSIDIRAGPQGNQWNQVHKGIKFDDIQFITVENCVPIELLRTGDKWDSGPYKFICKPTQLEYHWQSNRHMGSCHPSTHPNAIGGEGQNFEMVNTWQWGDRDTPGAAATKVDNFHIGYQWPEWHFHYSSGGPCVNPGQPSSMSPWLTPQVTRLTTGASEKAVFDYAHGEMSPNEKDKWWQGNQQMTGQTDYTPKNPHQEQLSNAVSSAAAFSTGTYHNTFGPFTAFDDVGAQYPWGAIWGKEPGTTHKPMESAHAPFMCQKGPPGQILVKLAANYTDTVDNNGNSSRIVTYATFWWSGTLVFKGKLRTPRQWNPMNFPNIPAHKQMNTFVPNEIGQFELPYMPGRAMPNITL